MSETIPPAMTRDQWATCATATGYQSPAELGDIMALLHHEHAAAMALANAQLPPDSPYKITREDIAGLDLPYEALTFLRNGIAPKWSDDEMRAAQNGLLRLAAKLAALLPPE